MLNLSDNELDRLSREAASHHEPGDPLGPHSWERLELRLDKELGRAGPELPRGARGFRRLPFQYAPVILLMVGFSWYFVKLAKSRKGDNSGSPPLRAEKAPQQQGTNANNSSNQNPVYSDKSTSTPYHQDQSQNIESATVKAPESSSSVAGSSAFPPPATHSLGNGDRAVPAADHSNAPTHRHNALAEAANGPDHAANPNAGLRHSQRDKEGDNATALSNRHLTAGTAQPTGTGGAFDRSGASGKSGKHGRSDKYGASGRSGIDGLAVSSGRSGRLAKTGSLDHTDSPDSSQASLSGKPGSRDSSPTGRPDAGTSAGRPRTPTSSGPDRAFVQHPASLRSRPTPVDDSTLRAYAANHPPTNPGRSANPGLRVNRSLSFGIQVAPDFSSVNALAGDKPGSSLGLTVEYQFADRWHIGTGLLFARKNYTARGTDYKVPRDYYRSIGLDKRVDFVKGSMTMLEIPLNIRYDFSIAGNTVFFASGGLSSYLFGKENSFYYFDYFGREICRKYPYRTGQNIFASANLSLGVETGISNDFSLMIAPYMKLPTSDMGFGKVRMSSVGITVGLRYSPVISRKRQH